MMLGTGEGIAIAGICGTVIAAIIKLVPRKNSHNPGNPGEYVTEKLCDERSSNIEERLDRLSGYLKEVKTEILAEIRKKKE